METKAHTLRVSELALNLAEKVGVPEEELMHDIVKEYTIIIVTHNMQQAARVSDFTAMMMIDENRSGRMIEFDNTQRIFTNPKDKRTEDYVTGRFG